MLLAVLCREKEHLWVGPPAVGFGASLPPRRRAAQTKALIEGESLALATSIGMIWADRVAEKASPGMYRMAPSSPDLLCCLTQRGALPWGPRAPSWVMTVPCRPFPQTRDHLSFHQLLLVYRDARSFLNPKPFTGSAKAPKMVFHSEMVPGTEGASRRNSLRNGTGTAPKSHSDGLLEPPSAALGASVFF